MAQTWTDDTFAAGHVAQTDLQNMENNFACLKSSFSGAAAPANTVAGMLWFETDQLVLKVRNNADSAWYGLMHGDTSEKRLVYRDAAMDGYARDSGVTDRIIALKGGAIYVAGAATAGSWTIPDHTLLTAEVPAHTHGASGAHTHTVRGSATLGAANVVRSGSRAESNLDDADAALSAGSDHTHTSVGGGGAHNHGATYRPAAAVCILVYLDL